MGEAEFDNEYLKQARKLLYRKRIIRLEVECFSKSVTLYVS